MMLKSTFILPVPHPLGGFLPTIQVVMASESAAGVSAAVAVKPAAVKTPRQSVDMPLSPQRFDLALQTLDLPALLPDEDLRLCQRPYVITQRRPLDHLGGP